uniref:hypothetical protein n=1 Tax=Pseudonocardia sp. CA-138482 TaxID=3240023 RepID=UPI003F492043
MGVLPSPYAWAIADSVTATLLNSQIRDGFGWFLNPPRAVVYNSAAQSIPGVSSSSVLATWNTAVINSDGMWASSPNPSRLTAQTAGVYLINAHVQWQPLSSAQRALYLTFNSNGSVSSYTAVGYHMTIASITDTTVQSDGIRIFKYLTVGDYVELLLDDTSSSTVNTVAGATTFFSARWVAGG